MAREGPGNGKHEYYTKLNKRSSRTYLLADAFFAHIPTEIPFRGVRKPAWHCVCFPQHIICRANKVWHTCIQCWDSTRWWTSWFRRTENFGTRPCIRHQVWKCNYTHDEQAGFTVQRTKGIASIQLWDEALHQVWKYNCTQQCIQRTRRFSGQDAFGFFFFFLRFRVIFLHALKPTVNRMTAANTYTRYPESILFCNAGSL